MLLLANTFTIDDGNASSVSFSRSVFLFKSHCCFYGCCFCFGKLCVLIFFVLLVDCYCCCYHCVVFALHVLRLFWVWFCLFVLSESDSIIEASKWKTHTQLHPDNVLLASKWFAISSSSSSSFVVVVVSSSSFRDESSTLEL